MAPLSCTLFAWVSPWYAPDGYRLIGKPTIVEVGPSGKVGLAGGKRKKILV
ncbi:MAG: hypothetical protein QF504_05380 [Nitrospinaceae bacterium]|nr:hypothetical protein [Nitrospinaceae bacterium]